MNNCEKTYTRTHCCVIKTVLYRTEKALHVELPNGYQKWLPKSGAQTFDWIESRLHKGILEIEPWLLMKFSEEDMDNFDRFMAPKPEKYNFYDEYVQSHTS